MVCCCSKHLEQALWQDEYAADADTLAEKDAAQFRKKQEKETFSRVLSLLEVRGARGYHVVPHIAKMGYLLPWGRVARPWSFHASVSKDWGPGGDVCMPHPSRAVWTACVVPSPRPLTVLLLLCGRRKGLCSRRLVTAT